MKWQGFASNRAGYLVTLSRPSVMLTLMLSSTFMFYGLCTSIVPGLLMLLEWSRPRLFCRAYLKKKCCNLNYLESGSGKNYLALLGIRKKVVCGASLKNTAFSKKLTDVNFIQFYYFFLMSSSPSIRHKTNLLLPYLRPITQEMFNSVTYKMLIRPNIYII